MPIVAFAGQKGGVGKSTAALSVACEWHAKGSSVLVCDADPQGTARTFAAVAAEAGHEAPTVVGVGDGLERPDQVPKLSRSHDWTVIDCPPRMGKIQRAAMMIADVVILPCGPSTADAWALAESVALVNEALQVRPQLRAAVLLTRRVARTAIGDSAREVLADSGLPILRAEMGYRTAYQEALAAGLGVTRYATRSPAANEVRALVRELERLAQGKTP
jgi:chromosome partitioning protein